METAEFNSRYKRKYFSDTDLSGEDLSKTWFPNFYFERAKLYGTNFAHGSLRRCHFTGADLRKANFTCAELGFSNFRDCNLLGANLIGAHIHCSDFRDAKIDYCFEDGLLQRVAEAILNSMNSNDNNSCREVAMIEWACKLSKNGNELRKKYGRTVTELLLLGAEAHFHCYKDVETRKKWLMSVLT